MSEANLIHQYLSVADAYTSSIRDADNRLTVSMAWRQSDLGMFVMGIWTIITCKDILLASPV